MFSSYAVAMLFATVLAAVLCVAYGRTLPEAFNCANVEIVSRAAWNARPPRSTTPLNTPLPRTFIHHTVTGRCFDQAACSAICRSVQNYHMDSNGWSDIGYNFLIGEDGRAYEGRGWDTHGAHAGNYNGVSHGISVMGDFTSLNPNSAALAAIENLIACGVSLNKIQSSYSLHGHRDGMCTACPGNYFFANWVSRHSRYGGRLEGGC